MHHECYNPYGARIVEINDNGGVLESYLSGDGLYHFTPDILFGDITKIRVGIHVAFTKDLKGQVACVHL